MAEIKLTVYLSTFNQEKYIREAMDSILMQKTAFDWELLVADDCSADKTQAIVLEYQAKYPEKIKTYFTPVNVGGCKKFTDCIDKGLLRGEYIALLEGDDYWLNENRLQIMVDFLEQNLEYSRVSSKRRVIDENGNDKGFDVAPEVLNKKFTISDFLEGRNYSDFGSVFRNYFLEAGDKYNELICASRNVLDFQDMFITQDFGPVFVMDKCLGVYRSISAAGASNYNSIMSTERRCIDKINIARAVEKFYDGKYNLSIRIRREQKLLYSQAIRLCSYEKFNTARKITDKNTELELLTENLYLAIRGKNKTVISFVMHCMTTKEKFLMPTAMLKLIFKRIYRKIKHLPYEDKRRGFINPEFGDRE